MKNKLLLVDFNNMIWRSVAVNSTLSHRGKFTGGVYGFINMLCSVVNRYEIERVVVCKDTKPYLRCKFFKDYKLGRRDGLPEEDLKRVSVARKQVNDLIRRFGFPEAKRVGYEADDFIGSFCRRKMKHYDRIFVLSTDSDLYQLLGGIAGNVFLVGGKGLYGQHHFCADFPTVDPEKWPQVLALMGSHNGVPGIHGVGKVTAAKLIAANTTLEQIQEKYGHPPDEVKLRQQLATLPFPLVPRPTLPRVGPLDYDAKRFEEVCIRYGIRFKNEFHDAFMRLSGA